MGPMRVLAAVLVAALLAGCVIFPRRLEVPAGDEAVVMVLSNRLGGPLRRIARHAYLAVREPGQAEWTIWECCPPGRGGRRSDPFVPSFGDEVRLHAVHTGRKAERMIPCIAEATERYGRPGYVMYPGPNSNTYVEAILRRCRIRADLPATAVGKDFRGWFGAGVTSGRTGVQIETPILGLKLGITEGIELHVFGLSIGIDLWPPALILPVGEGRLGFGDR
jgi:hypothetical protein